MMTIVDKKVRTLGEKGRPMYFTAAQLKQAIAKYPQHVFTQVTNPPKGQAAYIIASASPPAATDTRPAQ